jgi:archaemetzincin
MEFDIFYSANSAEFKDIVTHKLKQVFGVKTKDRNVMEVYEGAYNIRRRQFDARILLDHLLRSMTSVHAIWIVDRDMYYDNLNFVMGLAMFHLAGVVSTYRLTSAAMVAKECVHEAGHVLGLEHCKNDCVMRFSSSIEDAEAKQDVPCDRCRDIFNRKIIEARPPF